jgi:hypothetical protein
VSDPTASVITVKSIGKCTTSINLIIDKVNGYGPEPPQPPPPPEPTPLPVNCYAKNILGNATSNKVETATIKLTSPVLLTGDNMYVISDPTYVSPWWLSNNPLPRRDVVGFIDIKQKAVVNNSIHGYIQNSSGSTYIYGTLDGRNVQNFGLNSNNVDKVYAYNGDENNGLYVNGDVYGNVSVRGGFVNIWGNVYGNIEANGPYVKVWGNVEGSVSSTGPLYVNGNVTGVLNAYSGFFVPPDAAIGDGYLTPIGTRGDIPANVLAETMPAIETVWTGAPATIGTMVEDCVAPPTLTLTRSVATTNEGTDVTYTLTTTNIPDGTIVPWTISGDVNADDFTSPASPMSGNFTVQNGQATQTFTVKNDRTTEGLETMIMTAGGTSANQADGTAGGVQANINITDTSLDPTYTLTRNVAVTDEGTVVTFTLTTTEVDNGAVIPWTMGGSVNAADFTAPATPMNGTFVIQNGQATQSFTIANDQLTEGTETMTMTVTPPEVRIPPVSASIQINDTSLDDPVLPDDLPDDFSDGGPVQCNVLFNEINGGQQMQRYTVILGTDTGTCTLTYDAYTIPDRFVVFWNNVLQFDTGYRGDPNWQPPPPGPVVGPGAGSDSFNKTAANPAFAYVYVYAPDPQTGWTCRLSCPA